MFKELALDIIKYEEGCRLRPYYCSEQYPTIGWGFRIGARFEVLPTIEWTQQQADENLKAVLEKNLKTILGNPDISGIFSKLNDTRKAVFLSMAHQLGVYGVLKFKKFLAALARQDWISAHDEMLNSLAFRQAPHRWRRQAKMMLSGELLENYK